MDTQLKVKLLTDTATVPTRGTPYSAGYDLYSDDDYVISPQGTCVISTGIAVEIPQGYYGRVAPRSSLTKLQLDVGAGVVDSDYRGEVKIVMFNHSPEDYYCINKGNRMAQLILQKIATPDILVVDELTDTDRGEGGFGSTGMF